MLWLSLRLSMSVMASGGGNEEDQGPTDQKQYGRDQQQCREPGWDSSAHDDVDRPWEDKDQQGDTKDHLHCVSHQRQAPIQPARTSRTSPRPIRYQPNIASDTRANKRRKRRIASQALANATLKPVRKSGASARVSRYQLW